MGSNSYQTTLEWLYGLEAARGMDLKLDRVRAALDALGAPHTAYATVHVAGTNGKGSVAAMVHAILGANGQKVGLYTSPHLVDFRERVRVDGRMIDEEHVVDRIAHIRDRVQPEANGITFFEMATLLAFDSFARARVDVAVLEVGLGGRLDATNVIDGDVAVITSIGIDHERFLGSTQQEIAREKAGILRRSKPAIVGRLRADARAAVESVAAEVGALPEILGRDFDIEEGTTTFRSRYRCLANLEVGLLGQHQRDNAALAVAAVDALPRERLIEDETVRRALRRVRWPGRLELVSADPAVIFDAAHNVDSAAALVRELPKILDGREVDLLFGVLGDKRWQEMVDLLGPSVDSATCTSVPVPRGERPEIVARAFAEYCPTRVCKDPGEALEGWFRAGGKRVLLVAGSVFLLGALYPVISRLAPTSAGASDA